MTKTFRFRLIAAAVFVIVMTEGTLNSYAGIETSEIESSLQSNESYSVNPSDIVNKRHWDKKPSGWRYLDENNKPIIGYFYDTTGDFFYAKDDGFILEDAYDIWGQYYSKDGYIDISGYNYDTDYIELSRKLEAGDNIYFDTVSEVKDFIEYYGKAYNMSKQTLNFKVYKKKKKVKATGKVIKEEYFINNSLNTIYDRDDIIKEVDTMFPERLIEGTVSQKISAVEALIASRMHVDNSNLDMSLSDALKEKKGCCWHFVKIAQQLLERDGIACEIITGKAYGISHIWLRVLNENGAWIYSDPTFVANNMHEFDNIDYRVYKDNYRVYNFFGN